MEQARGNRTLIYAKIAGLVTLIIILVITSYLNYLLFHTVIELFAVLVGFGIAAIALHTYKISYEKDNLLTFLGVAYFCIAIFDFLHTMAYNGMGVFSGDTSNLATQLWIIPRYLEAAAFLAIPLLVTKSQGRNKIYLLFPVASIILLIVIFSGIFPDCFIPGLGLTPFKIISEYIISAFLFIAALLIIKNRKHFDNDLLKFTLLACATTILSELLFTFYVSVYGLSNMFGHLWKLASYYFIYIIVIRKKLLEPYDTIQELYQSMERKVATRTRELEAANLRLREGQNMLKQLNQKLSDSSRHKSEFMATITHELRTPLTSVVAFSELLLDEVSGPINDEQRENLRDIRTGAQQLMILISDILDMAKFEAGQLRVELESVDLNDVFRIVRRTMSAIAHQNNISLDVKKVDLPLVYGDPERIRQMIVNLVANAIKFTKEGGHIELSAENINNLAAIKVKDNGVGIAPEVIPHIFEKFRQGDASMKRSRGGTGLGLALVKTFAELQGGEIAVTSELGQGSQFTIYLTFAPIADHPE